MDCSRHLPDALVLPRRGGAADRGPGSPDHDRRAGLPAVLSLRPQHARADRSDDAAAPPERRVLR